MRNPILALLPLTLALSLHAQESKFGPRSFFPADYNGEIRVDVGRLVDLGVVAELMRSPLGSLTTAFSKRFGFSIEELEKVTFAIREGGGEAPDSPHVMEAVWVMEGGPNVGITERLADGTQETIEGVRFATSDALELCSPKAGLLVMEAPFGSSRELISSVLRGKRKGGVPVPALLDLTTKPHTLASVTRLIPDNGLAGGHFFPGMDETWIVASDPVAAIAMRVFEHPKTEALTAELVLRYQKGEEGPQLFLTKLEALLKQAVEMKELRTVKSILTEVKTRVEGRDAVASIEFGSGRDAVGKLGKLGLLVGMWGMAGPVESEVVEPQTAPAQPIPVPAPEPKKKDGEDGKR